MAIWLLILLFCNELLTFLLQIDAGNETFCLTLFIVLGCQSDFNVLTKSLQKLKAENLGNIGRLTGISDKTFYKINKKDNSYKTQKPKKKN